MTWRKLGMVVAVGSTFINGAGAVPAAMEGDFMHAATHALLFVLSASAVWWLLRRRHADRIRLGEQPLVYAQPEECTDSLNHLERTVDSVAVEVERIGEAQRFMARLISEANAAHAEPIELKTEVAPPDVTQFGSS